MTHARSSKLDSLTCLSQQIGRERVASLASNPVLSPLRSYNHGCIVCVQWRLTAITRRSHLATKHIRFGFALSRRSCSLRTITRGTHPAAKGIRRSLTVQRCHRRRADYHDGFGSELLPVRDAPRGPSTHDHVSVGKKDSVMRVLSSLLGQQLRDID